MGFTVAEAHRRDRAPQGAESHADVREHRSPQCRRSHKVGKLLGMLPFGLAVKRRGSMADRTHHRLGLQLIDRYARDSPAWPLFKDSTRRPQRQQ